jgi:toxin CptA
MTTGMPMEILLTSAAFLAAAVCAGLMGYAIQRGATCTVAAMDEIVRKRGVNRLASMFAASLWVLGGLAIAQSLHLLGAMPAGYSVAWATVLGGALLGLGAYVNRACVFGAIARLGSGEWAYVATPIGFYAGCVTVSSVFPFPAPPKVPYDPSLLRASTWIAVPFGIFALWRISRSLLAMCADRADGPLPQRLARALATRVWSPHAATTVIGVTFLLMLLLVGAWAYTDVLAELAHGMAGSLVARCLLLLALFGGALLGGCTAGRWRSTPVSVVQLAKCLSGGLLMGWGSLLIPGGNDGLILVGIPLLRPYAWIAFLTMCAAIGAALQLEKAVVGHGAEQAVH